MSDPAPNLTLVIKLLKMTTSSNDGEALTAMRKANDQVTKVGWDWEKLLLGKVTIIADPFASTPEPKPRHHTPPAPPTPPSRPAPPPPPSPPRPRPRPTPQPQPQPTPQPRPVAVRNKFGGRCVSCHHINMVQPGDGWAIKNHGSSKWEIQCDACHTVGRTHRVPRHQQYTKPATVNDLMI